MYNVTVIKNCVTYLDHMGTDLDVCNAARVSFDKYHEMFKMPDDERLIYYLAVHNHFTPFTHQVVKLKLKMPISIARQWLKSGIGQSSMDADTTINEVSRRYVTSKPEFFVPDFWRKQSESKKQGSDGYLEEVKAQIVQDRFEMFLYQAENLYNDFVNYGLAAEQARFILPQNTMTEFWQTGSLYFWARICKQRLDIHAQYETQEYAKTVSEIIQPLFPISWKALMKVTKE